MTIFHFFFFEKIVFKTWNVLKVGMVLFDGQVGLNVKDEEVVSRIECERRKVDYLPSVENNP